MAQQRVHQAAVAQAAARARVPERAEKVVPEAEGAENGSYDVAGWVAAARAAGVGHSRPPSSFGARSPPATPVAGRRREPPVLTVPVQAVQAVQAVRPLPVVREAPSGWSDEDDTTTDFTGSLAVQHGLTHPAVPGVSSDAWRAALEVAAELELLEGAPSRRGVPSRGALLAQAAAEGWVCPVCSRRFALAHLAEAQACHASHAIVPPVGPPAAPHSPRSPLPPPRARRALLISPDGPNVPDVPFVPAPKWGGSPRDAREAAEAAARIALLRGEEGGSDAPGSPQSVARSGVEGVPGRGRVATSEDVRGRGERRRAGGCAGAGCAAPGQQGCVVM